MKDFEVHYESFVTIQAENFEDARKKFIDQYPLPLTATSFFDCETHEAKEVIGHCEMSDLPIFEDDEYCHDEEGVMWLKREEEE